MVQRQVVIRTGTGQSERRLGEITERLGSGIARVRWPDGVEEDLKIGMRHVITHEGSLRYQHLLQPETLQERLRDDPVSLILQLLRESQETMKPQELRRRLTQLDLDADAVARAWKAVKKHIDKHDHVIVSGKPASYRWTDTPLDPHAKLKALPVTEALTLLVEAELPHEEQEALKEALRTSAIEPVQRLVAQAIAVELGPSRAEGHGLLKNPLRAGISLAEFSTPVLNKLLQSPGIEESAVSLALLACVPRKLRFLDDIDLISALGKPAVEQLIKNSLDELGTGPKKAHSDLAAAMGGLVDNLTRSAEVSHLSPRLIIKAMMSLPAKGRGQQARTQLTHVIAQQVQQWREDDLPLERNEIDALADAVTTLPMDPRGPRAQLLAALHTLSLEITRAPGWWRNLTLRDVIATGEGLLQRVWSDPVIAREVVRPLVSTTLASAATRQALAQVVGAPAVVADHVDPAEFRAAWEKVARSDNRAGGWLEAMRANAAQQLLAQQLEQARSALLATEEERDLAKAARAELEARADRLAQLLSEAHAVSRDMTDQEVRQRAIDSLRPLVALAIETETLVAGSQPADLLFDRIHALVAAHGLRPLGACGATVQFDATVHEAVADQPPAGAAVSVLRPGYTWQWNDEEIVMEKALISH